ncbi:probable N-acetyltransferase HLS1 [Euphorbia lathyris]|uniref:probable N-acetyltransferase HLS1 n=1 Tax=Euphorbia lathyris TaxID=212925 RepID=UPI0033141BC0
MLVEKKKVLIREYKEERDRKVVGKLERNCEIGTKKEEVSIFTNIMGDPLRRIRLYPLHVLLVAELCENGEIVGVVRGCIKYGKTEFGAKNVRFGCILGLRVSPNHQRMGIGLKLVKSIEEWLIEKGATYIFVATEKKNIASTNLFISNCNYTPFTSLIIFVQPTKTPLIKTNNDNNNNNNFSHIKTEKLQTHQAISLYNTKLKTKHIYPTDIDSILQENLNLGTWVSYFKEEEWLFLHENGHEHAKTPSSWVVFSMWNSCEGVRKSSECFKIFPCLKVLEKEQFGFLFLYGMYGEGERLEELMKSIWSFATKMGENVKDCKMIITELSVGDPLMEFVPHDFSSMAFIDDLWYLKKVRDDDDDGDHFHVMGEIGNVFVDPRDF